MMLLGKDLIVLADSWHGLHGTGQIIIAGDGGLVGSTLIPYKVFATQDGLDSKYFECGTGVIFGTRIKPLSLDLSSLFASKLLLELRHGTVHELLLSLRDTKEYSMILGILKGSKISFDQLGGIVKSFDHGFHLVNVSSMIILWGKNLSETFQQVTGRKMGRKLAADMEALKHVLAKPGE